MLAGGDLFRSRDLDMAGIPRVVLKRMLAAGELDQPQRGVYRIPEIEADETRMKAAEIASRHPNALLCLMSAMRWHGMTDDMNSPWTICVKRTSPVVTAPWVRVVRWTGDGFHDVGVVQEKVAGVEIRMTSPARTVADVMRRVNGFSDEIAFKAFVAYLRTGGEPEAVGRVARKLGFHNDIGRMVPFARQILSGGAFQQLDPASFEF
jgi:predicted transcriptional regulator of viral defense system